MKLVVGLGNPGKEYENTRHNTGRILVGMIEDKIKDSKIKFITPDTFMNNSGKAVNAFVKSKKDLKNLVVIYDDLDLEPGDYLGVETENKKIVFEPQSLMSRELATGIAESIRDFKEGRSHGPFNTAEEAIAHLHAYVKNAKGKRKQAR